MNNQFVRDWMTPQPITITPKTTLPEARIIMIEKKIRRLPVLKKNTLVGIVTFGDIREALPSDATSLNIHEVTYLLERLNAKDFMTSKPVTVSPDTTIAEAARLMLEHKVGGLPVMEGEKLVGIITETDLCRLLIAEREPTF
jgi:acetoin utilization protein AcuB